MPTEAELWGYARSALATRSLVGCDELSALLELSTFEGEPCRVPPGMRAYVRDIVMRDPLMPWPMRCGTHDLTALTANTIIGESGLYAMRKLGQATTARSFASPNQDLLRDEPMFDYCLNRTAIKYIGPPGDPLTPKSLRAYVNPQIMCLVGLDHQEKYLAPTTDPDTQAAITRIIWDAHSDGVKQFATKICTTDELTQDYVSPAMQIRNSGDRRNTTIQAQRTAVLNEALSYVSEMEYIISGRPNRPLAWVNGHVMEASIYNTAPLRTTNGHHPTTETRSVPLLRLHGIGEGLSSLTSAIRCAIACAATQCRSPVWSYDPNVTVTHQGVSLDPAMQPERGAAEEVRNEDMAERLRIRAAINVMMRKIYDGLRQKNLLVTPCLIDQ